MRRLFGYCGLVQDINTEKVSNFKTPTDPSARSRVGKLPVPLAVPVMPYSAPFTASPALEQFLRPVSMHIRKPIP